jgi:hypothetical protein
MSLYDGSDVTFVITANVTSIEHLENLKACTDNLLKYFNTHITVLNITAHPSPLIKACVSSRIDVQEFRDENNSINFSRYINQLVPSITTNYISIWDADLIVDHQQIIRGLTLLKSNKAEIVYYDGHVVHADAFARNTFFRSRDISSLILPAPETPLLPNRFRKGSLYIAQTAAYKKTGMKNEKIMSRGIENYERMKRWKILAMNISKVKAPVYKLSGQAFPQNEPAWNIADDIAELLRISNMKKKELTLEISGWNQA